MNYHSLQNNLNIVTQCSIFKDLVLQKQDFRYVCSTHCFIHRKVLMMKLIPDEPKIVFDLK